MTVGAVRRAHGQPTTGTGWTRILRRAPSSPSSPPSRRARDRASAWRASTGRSRRAGASSRSKSRPGRARHSRPPAAAERPAGERPIARNRSPGRAGCAPGTGGPLVLIAEDEELVRELVTRILVREGFDVHAAADGPAALQILERIARPVEVLVTDIVMPGMDGRKLAERVVERSPGTSVVFMSGYSERAIGSRRLGGQSVGVSQEAVLAEGANRGGPLCRAAPRGRRESARRELRQAKSLTCLVADDHPAVLDAVSRYLETAGIAVLAARRACRRGAAADRDDSPGHRADRHRDRAVQRDRAGSQSGRSRARDQGDPLHREPRPGTARQAADIGVRGFRPEGARRSPSLSTRSILSRAAVPTSTPIWPARSPRP